MTTKPSEFAAQQVLTLRSVERNLASCGFYEEAGEIRKQRERVERCSQTSVDDMNPDHGHYSPKTIGSIADEIREAKP